MINRPNYPTWLVARALGQAASAKTDANALRASFELAFIPPGLADPAALLLTFALDRVDWDALALANQTAAPTTPERAARFARRPLAEEATR